LSFLLVASPGIKEELEIRSGEYRVVYLSNAFAFHRRAL
jgi:hypothetical protein